MILLCALFYAQAQSDAIQYESLEVGDKVPDLLLTNLINYRTRTARVSDFKGKLLILDFWFSGCKPCIESWSKLLKLQKEFKNSIQILLVNPLESEASVLDFIKKRKEYARVNMILPSVCKGTSIVELFPVPSYPYVVVINEEGFVKSLGNPITSETIQSLIKQ